MIKELFFQGESIARQKNYNAHFIRKNGFSMDKITMLDHLSEKTASPWTK